ncbi:ANTAR domain-containing protein [Kribbella sp. NPDC056861]|uniref:ANTAR domain-containing protein n=1 Tax=Kribbella sp. NPDC056861 TaxID=3154857 RepID=UPI00342C146C
MTITVPQPGAATAPVPSVSDLAPGLDQVLRTVLELAVVGGHCEWATIRLRATKRYAAITVSSDPRPQPAPRPVGELAAPTSRECSVFGVELAAGRDSFGVIGFYAAHSRGFSATEQAAAQLIAVQAALTIGAVRAAAELSEAIGTCTVVAQAQGIVMERYRLDGARAFEVLRRYSQDHNIKLRDIAHDVVVSGLLPAGRPRRRSRP